MLHLHTLFVHVVHSYPPCFEPGLPLLLFTYLTTIVRAHKEQEKKEGTAA